MSCTKAAQLRGLTCMHCVCARVTLVDASCRLRKSAVRVSSWLCTEPMPTCKGVQQGVKHCSLLLARCLQGHQVHAKGASSVQQA